MARSRRRSALPGFGPALGFTLFYLGLVVLLPLAALFWKTASLGWSEFLEAAAAPRVLAAYKVSFGTALGAATFNLFAGLLVAWVLVRYRFPGRAIADALVDLPFALPTAVAGITLTTLLAKTGWIGSLLEPLGIQVAFTPLGIGVALVFIGLPFVVRQVQPVLEDLDAELEEAAASLGATRLQTFRRVLLPALTPALLTGAALAFARGVGEYGSVVFISGNMPFETEIAPLLIVTKLEQYDEPGATAIAIVMLAVSLSLLLTLNAIQAWTRAREAR
jgi:sulfate transport system permease protein